MRKIGNIIHFAFISFLFYSCNNKEITSHVQIKKLHYPSASAIEYFDGKLYVMGDDATNLLVLDTGLNTIDSVSIFSSAERRMPKATKPDLEASAIFSVNNEPVIVFWGSGSLDPYRNAGWKYALHTKTKDSIHLQTLYSKIKASGIEQLNIEGAVMIRTTPVDWKLLLSNRGNKSYPYNHLICVDENFLKNDSNYKIQIISFDIQKDTSLFNGISGLTYGKQNDQLILTVSTEDTRNAYDDGTIGKSYLWIINNISGKLNSGKLNLNSLKPDKIIDLENIDTRFKDQKIESATVIEETKESIRLVLVADNDDGSSTIFKLALKKE